MTRKGRSIMIIALAGNQNCGKTTLFNSLTGANQHVGNFPGVTVDQKSGIIKGTKDCTVVDLPGIYSIRPYTNEEIITRDFIIQEKPDGIINIVDATNIERNLYLTLQLLEMQIPTILVLNMMDEVRGNGGSIDVMKLSEKLGVPVVPISAAKNEGISEVVDKIISTAKNKVKPKVTDFCPYGAVHRCIHAVMHIIADHADRCGISARFAAMKLIEGDAYFGEMLGLNQNELELIEHSVIEMEQEEGLDRNAAIANMRYQFIESVCAETVRKGEVSRERTRSLKIDNILTHRIFGLPIFFGIMLLIFWLTFNVIGNNLSDLLSLGIDALTDAVDKGLKALNVNPVVQSLITDGVFAGVGNVLSFLPIIVTLFFFLSILEDTGYMARVAFVMDKLLRKIGLSGRSFVPMLIGFGCSVPAVMSTRTLASDRDRKLTIFLIPFMSCSAKIPIYAVFCAAFFRKYQALVMISMYVIGIVLGIITALLLKNTLFRGKPIPFVMELPNYRLPSMKGVVLLMWEKAREFIKKAFSIIFVASLVIWFLQKFDIRLNAVTDSADSLLAGIGRLFVPIFAPLGFGDWRAITSLIAGFSAKEAVVSTMGVLMNADGAQLTADLAKLFTPVTAFSFLLFNLLYTPCISAVAAIKKELQSGVKTLGLVFLQCAIAWIASFLFYQVASLII